jgi:hypothetical protein
MSSTNPPVPNVNTFNNLYWISSDTSLTQDVADKRYLRFPTAQGTENLAAINVAGIAAFNNDIIPADTTNSTSSIIDQNNLDLRISSCSNSLTANSTIKLYATSSTSAVVEQMRITNALTYLYSPVSFSNATPPVSTATQPASNDSSTKIPTTAWVQSAIASVPAPTSVVATLIGTYTNTNQNFGSWYNLTTTSNTQFVDLYILAGGGCYSKGASFSIGAPAKSGGGGGGSGGAIIYNRMPTGYINFQYRIEPQFVNAYPPSTGAADTPIWTGTITQSGTTITLVTTTSGAMVANRWIQLPTSTPNFENLNTQLYIVSGAGTSWTCLSSQGQTISTAVAATGANNGVGLDRISYWTGTLTQAGNIVTIVSSTTGSIATIDPYNTYVIVNGVTFPIQSVIANTKTGTTFTTNCSQTISTPVSASVFGAAFGTNVWCRYTGLQGSENSYTNYPNIGWVTGGNPGTNGAVNNTTFTATPGVGGAGGISTTYLTNGASFSGGKGNNGTFNDDVTGMTTKVSYGGNNPLLNARLTTINGVSQQIASYGIGTTMVNKDTSYYANNNPGAGAVIAICYSS